MTHKLEKLKATRLESQKKMHDTISEIIAAFHLPRVTSYEKLEEEVSKCRSVATKTRLLVKQLKIYIEGFGWRDHKKPMSSKDDRRVGSILKIYRVRVHPTIMKGTSPVSS